MQEKIQSLIIDKENEMNSLRREKEVLLLPKNLEGQSFRSLAVSQTGFAEFYTSDIAYEAVPDEARAAALTANPESVVVYVRPHGKYGASIGEGSAHAESGQPVKLWTKNVQNSNHPGDVFGNHEESLWALNPGDTLFVRSAGMPKAVKCFSVSRPDNDRIIVAKQVAAESGRGLEDGGSFSGILAEGLSERDRSIDILKSEIKNLTEQRAVAMGPVFEANLQKINERLDASGYLGIELTRTGFVNLNDNRKYDYVYFEAEDLEETILKFVECQMWYPVFAEGDEGRTRARLKAIKAEVSEGEYELTVFAPLYSDKLLRFGYSQAGFEKLVNFLDKIEINQARKNSQTK